MLRQLSLLIVLCSGLCGCQSIPSFAKWPSHRDRHEIDKRRVILNDLSMDDLREIEQQLFLEAAQSPVGVDFDVDVTDLNNPRPTADTVNLVLDFLGHGECATVGMERQFLHEQIVATARGSQVGLSDESGGNYSGTVLRAGPDHIEIMNCLSQETIPGPDGQKQCKTSHIPFLTVETSAVTRFVTIAPPPPGFPATDEEIDGSEYSVAEIVNRSGQRQRWGRAPEAVPSDAEESIATVR